MIPRNPEVDLKEIIYSMIYKIDVIVEALEAKGILTRQELLDKTNQLKAKRKADEPLN